MRIAFVDPAPGGFSPSSPGTRPLGGAQSGLAYLAPRLAALGHAVVLFTQAPGEGSEQGVSLQPIDGAFQARLQAIGPDVVVFNHFERSLFELRPLLRMPVVLWFHTAPQFQDVLNRCFERRDGRLWFDRVVFVSHWQKEAVERLHPMDPGTGMVIHNGISDHALRLAGDPAALAGAKADPWSWAYTSTPFRGLDLLVEVAEEARRAGCRPSVEVYSSMKVYGLDSTGFEPLYERIARTPGMRSHGSVDQRTLAAALGRVAVLSYPSTYPETFCIAAAEAMAAGCAVVSTTLGALPETTGGLARLVPYGGDRAVLRRAYLEAVLETSRRIAAETPAQRLERIAGQTGFVRARYDWSILARQWEAWLAAVAAAQPDRPQARQ